MLMWCALSQLRLQPVHSHDPHPATLALLSFSWSSTGIKVVIVSAGFAGLACAIECVRKGHEVLVLEKFKALKSLGDIISFGSNGLHDQIWPICNHLSELTIHNSKGEILTVQHFSEMRYGAHNYSGHRDVLHEVLFNYTKSLGVEIRLGQDVTKYDEDEGRAWVGSNGERIEADVVVGADGERSKARTLVLGYDDKPKSLGYAVYRAWFDAYEQGVDRDPLTDFMCKNGDAFYGWIGPDVHMLTSTARGGRFMSWVITHKDEADTEESWSFPGMMEDVLKVVEGYDPRCAEIQSKAPSCVDWKIVYRDPLPTWISRGGRILLIGDAAHPFLPMSAQGASQAVEDGVTLAVALQLSGKDNVRLAIQAWEKIREQVRDIWHKAKPEAKGAEVEMPSPEWLGHDLEKHAYEVYGDAERDSGGGEWYRFNYALVAANAPVPWK
ncbi:FAD/NAD P-binding domain-containing protein [Gloeophyllum trabeum ATCC 11539]|uniref:FAD/NAD P-binding domain-containing protein n=1 Tax=Gloeophyllum trabeum (strain ATCC 11539 / FP-39264 / Madison 617) TaxID=670483 RepID=S7R791_GLOTA|nr:FAD/NAD P-binding domain-containing protein [Gloeophyllum trabeum ATCC 11539]EPQ50250.1 FAD/NAD P-binding domain-containing protein [Gloeophyllum trabeum ATCC 11539]